MIIDRGGVFARGLIGRGGFLVQISVPVTPAAGVPPDLRQIDPDGALGRTALSTGKSSNFGPLWLDFRGFLVVRAPGADLPAEIIAGTKKPGSGAGRV